MKPYEVRIQLQKIRRDKSLWELFQCDKGKNETLRLALAKALQYDRKKEDQSLIRYALEQEVQWKSIDPYQGYNETLNILSFLLARYRNTENAFLFERAKYANFDTACGYEELFAFTAGVQKTWDYVSQFELGDSNPIFFEEKDAYEDLTEEEIENLLKSLEDDYSDDRSLLSVEDLFEEALDLEDEQACQTLFSEIEKKENDCKALYDRAVRAELYEKAIIYGEAAYKENLSVSEKMYMALSLMRVYSLLGEYETSLIKAKDSHMYLTEDIEKVQNSIGLTFVERIFKTSIQIAEAGQIDYAKSIFNIGDDIYKKRKQMSHTTAELAYECCELTQSEHLPYYESQYNTYKADTEAFMDRVMAASRGEA
ncbi:MAG: hypothetical protein PQJ46_11925 [Spirochaetales bacterium]|nr:hypothetical protein [Spirochaetales bacterium]